MKKILGLTLVFVMLVSLLAVLPVAAADEDGYYAYLDQGITLVHRHGENEYSVSVAAKEIGETKTFECGCTESVDNYLQGLINSADSSAATKAVATALLNYGAAAKEYFEYVGADIFGTPATDVTALKAANAWDAEITDPNGIYLGATLVLDGTMKIRFFFNTADVEIDYDGNTLDVDVDEDRPGVYYFDVNVMPYAMKDYATIKATLKVAAAEEDSEEETPDEPAVTEIKYAPLNYLQAKADDANLSSMVASIYAYGEAAYAYYYEGCYVYPMDGIVLGGGCIDHYMTTGDSKHKYKTNRDEKAVFIDLTEIDYDTVTVTPNLNGETGFVTFLTKMPTANDEVVNYALNYNDMAPIREEMTLVIPENAKYLVVTNNYDNGTSCLPNTIVFSDTVTPSDNLKDDSRETYEYPMDTIKPSQGAIHSKSNTFISNFDWICSIVSLEDRAFNQVIFEICENGWVGYAFLTDYPTIGGSVPYVAQGEQKMTWVKDEPGTKVTADIPRNAVCMLLCYQELNETENVHYNYIPTSMTFTKEAAFVDPLEELQDETLSKYEYPMDAVIPADGAIFYWEDHKYTADANCKAAFIEITDTVFDTVTIGVDPKIGYAGWAFLTKMPALGESASYATGYDTFHWTDAGYSPENIVIPQDATYLVIYYQDSVNVPYCPESITFTQSTYSYPMDQLTPVDGYFKNQDKVDKNYTPTFRVTTTNENVAFVDLANLDYNTVTLLCNENHESGWYTFVTKRPINNDEKISYAMNCSGANWFGWGADKDEPAVPVTVTIPDNAAYLVVLYNYDNKTPTYPQSIVFSNSDTTPSEMLKNDTLDSYEYPMDAIKPSMGTIASDGNKFIQNYWWVGSYVGIEDCVFDKITFEIGESGKMSYAFLTAYPELDKVVSFAGGATKTTELTGAVGEKISVSIPDDAVCLYIYRHDWENSAPKYCLPASVTFRKINTLDKLQDPIRDEFSYPMNEVVSSGGAIIYWDETTTVDGKEVVLEAGGNRFLTNFYGHGDGFYQNAFIEITDTVFNYVSFRNNNVKTTGWAFLTELPTEGQAASYATGYTTFLWSGSTSPFNVEIPEDAKYLVLYYEEGTANYVPESITFSKNPINPVRFLQDSSSEYQYPMGAFTPTSTIVHYTTLVYGKFEAADMEGGDWKVVIIDITDTTFTQIQLTTKKNAKQWIGWTFLKEAPVEGQKVVLSDSDDIPAKGWASVDKSRGTTIDIPDDAKYFVYWYQDSATSQYLLDAVKFIKKD